MKRKDIRRRLARAKPAGRLRTSDDDRHKTSAVVLVEKVHRSFVSSRAQKTSDEDLPEDLHRIEIDVRHYCRRCKRKRAERHMEMIGRARFGKNSWACLDRFECSQVAKLKSNLR